MTTKEFESELPHRETRLEHVLHDVEHILHETESRVSHAAPVGIFCILTLLGFVVLVYRLIGG